MLNFYSPLTDKGITMSAAEKIVDVNSFIPVPIQEFAVGLSTPVDIYVKLSEDKYVLIIKAGEKATKERVHQYQNKKLEYLYIQEESYHLLSKHTITIAGIAIKGDYPKKQKAKFVSQAASTLFNEFEHMGLNANNFRQAQEITKNSLTLVEAHKDILDLLESLNGCSDEVIRHAMGTSILSVLIGSAMGWQNASTMEKLSVGGMLMDIGLKVLPDELVRKPLTKMTMDEVNMYETHPYRGMEMATQLGIIPDDVVSIIYEHEENAIAQGYPRRLRGLKMHPLSRVVALANNFMRLVIPSVNNPNPKTPKEALVYMDDVMGQPHNPEAFNALKTIINNYQFNQF